MDCTVSPALREVLLLSVSVTNLDMKCTHEISCSKLLNVEHGVVSEWRYRVLVELVLCQVVPITNYLYCIQISLHNHKAEQNKPLCTMVPNYRVWK